MLILNKQDDSMKRRSRFEICMEIIGLCQTPGLSRASLETKANVRYRTILPILFGLIDDQILRTETRKISPRGLKRSTEYFIRTPEGDALNADIEAIKERLSMLGAPTARETQTPKARV